MTDWLPGFIFTAALFGMRKLPGKNPELWCDLWTLHAQLGAPGLPITASWCQR